LIRSGKYLVYPRTETLEQVQTEYKTQLSGVTADEHLVDMGKGDNPRFVLSVAARRLGSQNMFNASIINLESGVQAIGRSVNYSTLDDGMQVMENLARELTGINGAFPSAGSTEALRDSAAAEAIAADNKAKEEAAAKAPRSGGRAARGTRKSGGAVFGYGILNLALGLGSFVQGDPGGGVFTLLSYGAAAGLVAWELTLAYEDDLAGIPGTVGLGVAGFAVLYGFIRPAVYNSSRPLAEIADGIGLSIVPGSRGGKAALLSYTIKF
jgi:hypothetical protein